MSTTIALTNSKTDEVKRPLSHQSTTKKIWVDLDNSPHVPFFRPIIEELKKRDYEVVVTARDAYQVRELVEFYGLAAKIAGKHYGKHKILKAFGTCWRALVLRCTNAKGEAQPCNLSRLARDANGVQGPRHSLLATDGLQNSLPRCHL